VVTVQAAPAREPFRVIVIPTFCGETESRGFEMKSRVAGGRNITKRIENASKTHRKSRKQSPARPAQTAHPAGIWNSHKSGRS
jgi:hypothetical protein